MKIASCLAMTTVLMAQGRNIGRQHENSGHCEPSTATRPMYERNNIAYPMHSFKLWQLWPTLHWCCVPVCEFGPGVCGYVIGEA